MRSILRSAYRLAAVVLAGSNIERFRVARWLNEIVTARIRTNTASINGFTFQLDEQDCMNLSILGDFESVETSLVQQEVKEGDVVVDIGANLGYFTVLFSNLVGPSGIVYAFEPDPMNFALLQRNVQDNGCRNVRLERKAVSDRSGSAQLYRSETDTVDHRLYNSENDRESIEVETVSLDDYFEDILRDVDFIKVDTQGAEHRVLKGMSRLLERTPSLKLLSEFWPFGLSKCGEEPNHYLEKLRDAGFTLNGYDRRTKNWNLGSHDTLLARHTVENERFTNLYCVKSRSRGPHAS